MGGHVAEDFDFDDDFTQPFCGSEDFLCAEVC